MTEAILARVRSEGKAANHISNRFYVKQHGPSSTYRVGRDKLAFQCASTMSTAVDRLGGQSITLR